MFVTVKYGDEKSKIFNADCKNSVLLENIKLQCGCGTTEVVEVSDERGEVKNLRKFPTEYGSEFLKQREVLVLLTVHNGGSNSDNKQSERPIFTPALSSLQNNKDFNDTLNQGKDEEDLESSISGRKNTQASDADDDNQNSTRKVKGQHDRPTQKRSISRKGTKGSLRK